MMSPCCEVECYGRCFVLLCIANRVRPRRNRNGALIHRPLACRTIPLRIAATCGQLECRRSTAPNNQSIARPKVAVRKAAEEERESHYGKRAGYLAYESLTARSALAGENMPVTSAAVRFRVPSSRRGAADVDFNSANPSPFHVCDVVSLRWSVISMPVANRARNGTSPLMVVWLPISQSVRGKSKEHAARSLISRS